MKIALIGASGRLGKHITEVAQERNHTIIPIDSNSTEQEINNAVCDIVIDFSHPQAITTTQRICYNNKAPLVCGTTGYNEEQLQILSDIASVVPVVHKANFSQSMDSFVTVAKTLLSQLPQWNISIEEQHRANKLDAPSGTALYIKKVLQQVTDKDIPITSIRKGDTVGIHTIGITDGTEQLTLRHTVNDRKAFALGCVQCAEQLFEQYTIKNS